MTRTDEPRSGALQASGANERTSGSSSPSHGNDHPMRLTIQGVGIPFSVSMEFVTRFQALRRGQLETDRLTLCWSFTSDDVPL